jgi:hypothetical protein
MKVHDPANPKKVQSSICSYFTNTDRLSVPLELFRCTLRCKFLDDQSRTSNPPSQSLGVATPFPPFSTGGKPVFLDMESSEVTLLRLKNRRTVLSPHRVSSELTGIDRRIDLFTVRQKRGLLFCQARLRCVITIERSSHIRRLALPRGICQANRNLLRAPPPARSMVRPP